MGNLISKAIGWAVIPGDAFAHYFQTSQRGLVAISRCFMSAKPSDLRPAKGQPHCAVCEILLDRSNDPSMKLKEAKAEAPKLVVNTNR